MPRYTDNDRLRWVSDGQKVIAPYPRPDGTNPTGRGVRCVVEKACGTTALVVSQNPDRFPFRKWLDVTELFPDFPPDTTPSEAK